MPAARLPSQRANVVDAGPRHDSSAAPSLTGTPYPVWRDLPVVMERPTRREPGPGRENALNTEQFKGSVIGVVGVALLIGATVAGLWKLDFMRRSIVVPGRVAALNAGGSHPEIQFVTRAGERISFPAGGWISGYKAGDAVTVRYRSDAPRRSATLNAAGSIWAAPSGMAIMGLWFVWGGLSAFWWTKDDETLSWPDRKRRARTTAPSRP